MAYFGQHFYLLTRRGDGDVEFMDMTFQKTIKENPNYEEGAVWAGFWRTMVELNIRMVVHNANILEPHPWQSRWNEWIFNKRGVSYYGKDLPLTYTAHMYLIGNHAIHWSVVVALGVFAALSLLYLRYRNVPRYAEWLGLFRPYFAQASFCLAVYVVNLAPYVAVARSTFCYHYMPALVYGELMVAQTIDLLAGPRHLKAATKVYLAIIGLVWFYYTPWIVRGCGDPLTLLCAPPLSPHTLHCFPSFRSMASLSPMMATSAAAGSRGGTSGVMLPRIFWGGEAAARRA